MPGRFSTNSIAESQGEINNLRKRVGRVFWAGEATNEEWQGSVHGAIRSGEVAAEEVLRFLSGGGKDEEDEDDDKGEEDDDEDEL